MNWPLFQNSLCVGLGTAVGASGLGFLGALALLGLDQRWRRLMMGLAVVALMMPPFLATDYWITQLGFGGRWRSWLPVSIYSLPGVVGILTLLTWPIPLLLNLGAWQKLEAHWLDSEPALSGFALIRWLLWPMARHTVIHSFLLVLVLAINHFTVPAILQVKVFPAEFWISFNTTMDFGAALNLSWPLVAVPLLLLAVWRDRSIIWPRRESLVAARIFRRQLGRFWLGVSGAALLISLALSVLLPLSRLLASRATWAELPAAWYTGSTAAGHSLGFAVVAATLTVLLGCLGRRWRLDLLWMLFFVPGVLLGVALIFVFNRRPTVWFYQSSGVVFLALTLRYLAIGGQAAAQATRSLDRELTEAAELDGATFWQRFYWIHWPMMSPQLLAAWYVTYLLCLWDVESLVLIVPPGGETLALRIFNLLHYGHNPQVQALCGLLLVLALLPLALWKTWEWRRSAWLHSPSVARLSRSLALLLLGAGALVLGCAGCRPTGNSPLKPLTSQLFEQVQILGSRGTGLGQFNKPRSVAVDLQDNVYVVDMTGRVQKFNSNGQFLTSWQIPTTDKGKPKGMDRDPQGGILLVEPHYARVNHFSAEGQLTAQWGQEGTNAGQLAFPRAVAVNQHHEIYVSEYGAVERIQRFSAPGGQLLTAFGQAGAAPGQLNRAEGLGTDAQDRLYVADSCNHRIQVFDREGHFLRTYGSPGTHPGELSYPYDIRVDTAGRQYVCEFGNSRIQIFDSQDRSLEILGRLGREPGEFFNPWSLALDSRGNLYVADSGNHRVQKFVRRP